MPFNGTGTFNRVYSWVTDAAGGILVRADRMDTDTNDIATGLSNCITRDGQSPPSANIPMATYRITGLGNGINPQDAVTFVQTFTSPAFTGVPTAPTAAVDTATTQIATTAYVVNQAYAKLAGPTFTGTVALPSTTSIGNVSATEISYLDGVTSALQTQIDAKAPLASPALTGVPTAPTAAIGTNTTQIATMAALIAQAFSATVPVTVSDAGKFLYTADGINITWASTGITNVVSSATSITLTSTNTLAVITPTSYGVTVKLQDATSDTPKDGYHAIANKGAYPVRVTDSTDTLLGFVYPGVKTNVALVTASAAGTWAFDNLARKGEAAQLVSANFSTAVSVVDIGSGREMVLGTNSATAQGYAVVYDRSTNTFGTAVLVRAASIGNLGFAAVSAGTDKVLAVSVTNASTAMEAVVLSVSGTTITVGTAATATLSAAISSFADGCGLIAVGSSWVFSYKVTTPENQLRAISVSGTTATIGSASVAPGSNNTALQYASGSVVVVASNFSTSYYVTPYTVSGSTLTLGTGAAVVKGAGQGSLQKFAAVGTRWHSVFTDNTGVIWGSVASLSGTTITLTSAQLYAAGTVADAVVVGGNKLLVLITATSAHANILTDTAGTASAGTAATLDGQATKVPLYVSGTDVTLQSGTTAYLVHVVDCSGASPVLSKTLTTGGSNTEAPSFSTSNAVLSRSPHAVYGTTYARQVWLTAVTQNFDPEVYNGVFTRQMHFNVPGDNTSPGAAYRGRNAGEIWIADASTVITKLEAAQ